MSERHYAKDRLLAELANFFQGAVDGLVEVVAVVVDRGQADQGLGEALAFFVEDQDGRRHADAVGLGEFARRGLLAVEAAQTAVAVGLDAAHDHFVAIFAIAAHGDEEFVEDALAITALIADESDQHGTIDAARRRRVLAQIEAGRHALGSPGGRERPCYNPDQ